MESRERFRPTGGRFAGWAGLALGLVLAVDGLFNQGWGRLTGGLLFAYAAWLSGLRPALWVDDRDLTFRNVFTTTAVPLAAIRSISIQQVLAVGAGDRRVVSPVIGRSLRRTLRGSDEQETAVSSYPVFVEERIRHRAELARGEAGVRMGSEAQAELAEGVRREVAWPLVAVAAALIVAFVITLLV